jgi:hypothetical protein
MAAPEPELQEKNFINEGYSKNPFPLWLWFFLLTVVIALLWGLGNWYTNKVNLLFRESPFLQVTNRDMSLFLWQNPEFMRINAKEKGSYLPAFQYLDKVTVDVAYADQYVTAPPDLIFRYHTWNRLLRGEFTERVIPTEEFRQFISYAEEWKPQYWPGAPAEYVHFIEGLPTIKVKDLSILSRKELPIEVRMAFQGWLNYFKDGEAINTMKISQGEMHRFLSAHPHYARNFWRNIVEKTTPNYLKGAGEFASGGDAMVPSDQIDSFLRVAVFNFLAAQKEEATPDTKRQTQSFVLPLPAPETP